MPKATPVGIQIVERIAAREGSDPVALDDQLYDVIDPDALESLTNDTGDRGTRANLRVEFTYHGYAVTVDGAGRVTIDERVAKAEADEAAIEGPVDD